MPLGSTCGNSGGSCSIISGNLRLRQYFRFAFLTTICVGLAAIVAANVLGIAVICVAILAARLLDANVCAQHYR